MEADFAASAEGLHVAAALRSAAAAPDAVNVLDPLPSRVPRSLHWYRRTVDAGRSSAGALVFTDAVGRCEPLVLVHWPAASFVHALATGGTHSDTHSVQDFVVAARSVLDAHTRLLVLVEGAASYLTTAMRSIHATAFKVMTPDEYRAALVTLYATTGVELVETVR